MNDTFFGIFVAAVDAQQWDLAQNALNTFLDDEGGSFTQNLVLGSLASTVVGSARAVDMLLPHLDTHLVEQILELSVGHKHDATSDLLLRNLLTHSGHRSYVLRVLASEKSWDLLQQWMEPFSQPADGFNMVGAWMNVVPHLDVDDFAVVWNMAPKLAQPKMKIHAQKSNPCFARWLEALHQHDVLTHATAMSSTLQSRKKI